MEATNVIKTSLLAITISIGASASTSSNITFNDSSINTGESAVRSIGLGKRRNDGLPDWVKVTDIEDEKVTPVYYNIGKTNVNYELFNKAVYNVTSIESDINEIKTTVSFLTKINSFFAVNQIQLSKFTASITTSQSAFFRINPMNSKYEFRFECFFEKESDDDMEAIAHIYKNNQKIYTQFGTIDELLETVHKVLSEPILFHTVNRITGLS